MEEEKSHPGHLFKQLMASINPFASYVLQECQERAKQIREDPKIKLLQERHWTLEESIFKNPVPPPGQTQ